MASDSGARPDDHLEALPSAEEASSQKPDGEDAGLSVPLNEELLANIPSGDRPAAIRTSSSVTQLTAPVLNPIFRRVTSEHLSQVIANAEQHSIRQHDAGKSRRRYQFAYFLLGIGATIGLIVFFTVFG